MSYLLLVRMLAKTTEDENGCWNWTGSLNLDGYGIMHFGHDERYKMPNRQAYRVMYEMVYGQIPSMLDVDHRCHNRRCINPEHLEAVPRDENSRRRRPPPPRTHCKRGYELLEENLVVSRNGARHCRPCWNEQKREWAHRSRA